MDWLRNIPGPAVAAVAGPLAYGASLGVVFGVEQAATAALLVPALVLGVAALMTPALYIGGSILGSIPTLDLDRLLAPPASLSPDGDTDAPEPPAPAAEEQAAPSASHTVRAVARGMSASGVTLLGLLPLALFLFATTENNGIRLGLGALGLAAAMLTGLVVLSREFFHGQPKRWRNGLMFLGWSVVALGIGLKFYSDLAGLLARAEF